MNSRTPQTIFRKCYPLRISNVRNRACSKRYEPKNARDWPNPIKISKSGSIYRKTKTRFCTCDTVRESIFRNKDFVVSIQPEESHPHTHTPAPPYPPPSHTTHLPIHSPGHSPTRHPFLPPRLVHFYSPYLPEGRICLLPKGTHPDETQEKHTGEFLQKLL